MSSVLANAVAAAPAGRRGLEPAIALGQRLAELIAYPTARPELHSSSLLDEVRAISVTAADHLARYLAAVDALVLEEHEELFTRTFDINPATALELGWHLFGEDYHRGTMLVRLRQELRRHAIDEGCELPDHLSHVLVLLDRMSPEEAEEFACACVIPAMQKMLSGLAASDNPYGELLRCIDEVIRSRFGASYVPTASESADPSHLLPIIHDELGGTDKLPQLVSGNGAPTACTTDKPEDRFVSATHRGDLASASD